MKSFLPIGLLSSCLLGESGGEEHCKLEEGLRQNAPGSAAFGACSTIQTIVLQDPTKWEQVVERILNIDFCINIYIRSN